MFGELAKAALAGLETAPVHPALRGILERNGKRRLRGKRADGEPTIERRVEFLELDGLARVHGFPVRHFETRTDSVREEVPKPFAQHRLPRPQQQALGFAVQVRDAPLAIQNKKGFANILERSVQFVFWTLAEGSRIALLGAFLNRSLHAHHRAVRVAHGHPDGTHGNPAPRKGDDLRLQVEWRARCEAPAESRLYRSAAFGRITIHGLGGRMVRRRFVHLAARFGPSELVLRGVVAPRAQPAMRACHKEQ